MIENNSKKKYMFNVFEKLLKIKNYNRIFKKTFLN